MIQFLGHGALSGIVKPGESIPLPVSTEPEPSHALAVVEDAHEATIDTRPSTGTSATVHVSIWEREQPTIDVEAIIKRVQEHADARFASFIENGMDRMLAKVCDTIIAAMGTRPVTVDDAVVGEEDGPIDLQRLGQQFLDEELKDETDKAKKSTFRSAFGYWWKTIGLDVYPHEGKIEDFGVICRRAASEDYALARQRVMRKFREWLEARDIRRSPNESVTPNAPITSSGNASTIPDAPTPDSVKWIVQITRDAIFGGEPSEDYWATLVRHVASDIGASGIARMCGVDEEMAERWIQLRKIPKIAREKLKYANLLLEIRKAKTESGKDLDDLWDEALEIEGFLSSGLGQDGY